MQQPIFDSCVLLINTKKKKKVVSFAKTIEIFEQDQRFKKKVVSFAETIDFFEHDQRFDLHIMSDQNKETKHVTFSEWAQIFHYTEILEVKKRKYGWNQKLWKTFTANKILRKLYKISP